MTLEDIGEGGTALLCMTDQPACCRPPYTVGKSAIGNWYFPNGSRVLSSGMNWNFHRTRGQSVVFLQRRRGGVVGVYRCVISDTMNATQNIYIGVYTTGSGEWYMYPCVTVCTFKKREVQCTKLSAHVWNVHVPTERIYLHYYSEVNNVCSQYTKAD